LHPALPFKSGHPGAFHRPGPTRSKDG
jgi:hypothetical protein